MPIEQMRSLSLLIFGAVTGSWISGDFLAHQWLIYMAVLLPLWTNLALDRIRRWPIWSLLVYATIIGFGLSQYFELSLKDSLFFLILTCVIYEIYGETRRLAPPRLLGLLSFLFLVAQIRSDFSLDKLLCITFYNLGLLAALVSFHNGGIPLNFRARAAFKGLGTLVLHLTVITGMGFLIFWILPRISEDSNGVMADFYEQQLSGFGSTVDLNDISSLQAKEEHIMNVTLAEGVEPHSRYVKGRVVNFYENGVWKSTTVGSAFLGNQHTQEYLRLHLDPESEVYEYRIDLAANRERVLFFFDSFTSIKGPIFPLEVTNVGYDLQKLSFDPGYGASLTYTVQAVDEVMPTSLLGRRNLLQVPPSMQGYLNAYTDRILGSEELAPLEAAGRLESYFRSSYTYSTEINNRGVADPIQHFIDNRRGHCELFASTMALMLRTRGIPTRLALGFLLPRKNQYSNFYYITTEEAHAWVEVYDGRSWRSFDPTAPSSEMTTNLWLQDRIEYLRWLFRLSVVTYDQEKQLSLLQGVPQAIRQQQILIFIGLILIAVALLGVQAWRTYRWNHAEDQLPLRMTQLMKLLQRKHGKRKAEERWDSYLRRIDIDDTQRAALLSFFSAYQHWRFAAYEQGKSQDLFQEIGRLEKSLSTAH
jgi:transglutaminase-like putative cysteine protease